MEVSIRGGELGFPPQYYSEYSKLSIRPLILAGPCTDFYIRKNRVSRSRNINYARTLPTDYKYRFSLKPVHLARLSSVSPTGEAAIL